MDLLRKIFHKAIHTPIYNIEEIWKEYDSFENNLSKLTVCLYYLIKSRLKNLSLIKLEGIWPQEVIYLPISLNYSIDSIRCYQGFKKFGWCYWWDINPLDTSTTSMDILWNTNGNLIASLVYHFLIYQFLIYQLISYLSLSLTITLA